MVRGFECVCLFLKRLLPRFPALRIQQCSSKSLHEHRSFPRRYAPPHVITIDNSTNIKGMSMTERQGGSDVQANTTTATPIGEGGPGQGYYLNGHKWFTSAPMSDAFLTLVRLFLLLLLALCFFCHSCSCSVNEFAANLLKHLHLPMYTICTRVRFQYGG